MKNERVVAIIDDDKDVLDALKLLMDSVGLATKTFNSASSFIEQYDSEQSSCIISDVRMPGMSGLELQAQLKAQIYHPPLIIITGHGDVTMAVKAVKAGALDFIEKPFNNQYLLDSVHKAIELDAEQRKTLLEQMKVEQKYKSLTPREKDVFKRVVKGQKNKEIASELHITQSTTETHRSKVMDKMSADSLSDLMHMGLNLKLI